MHKTPLPIEPTRIESDMRLRTATARWVRVNCLRRLCLLPIYRACSRIRDEFFGRDKKGPARTHGLQAFVQRHAGQERNERMFGLSADKFFHCGRFFLQTSKVFLVCYLQNVVSDFEAAAPNNHHKGDSVVEPSSGATSPPGLPPM